MEYTRLGRTALKVSRICLGTMNLGVHVDEVEAFALMDQALDLGVNFFDTADRYGLPVRVGITEELIGRWLAQRGQRGKRIVLATKLRGQVGPGINDRGLSAYHIRRACEDSLRRLQTDHIDLYQMHHVEREAPWEEIWQAMEVLVAQGKITYVGSSNFAGWHIAQAQAAARDRRFMGLVSEQSVYNLSNRTIELEVIPACRAHGLALLAYSPLAGGLLGGMKGTTGIGRRSIDATKQMMVQHGDAVEKFESLCQEIGAAPANVALAWLLHNPVLTCPIVGPRTHEQLSDALRSLELKLDAEVLKRLDEIWPGPGGEAPEAYAW